MYFYNGLLVVRFLTSYCVYICKCFVVAVLNKRIIIKRKHAKSNAKDYHDCTHRLTRLGAWWCGQVLAVHASNHTQTADTVIPAALRSHLHPVWTVHYRQTNLIQRPRTSNTLQLCDSPFEMATKNSIKVHHSRSNGANIKNNDRWRKLRVSRRRPYT